MMTATAQALVQAFRRAALPLVWYYAVTLVLPLANGAAESGAAFLTHAVVVAIVPPILVVLVCAVRGWARTLASIPGRQAARCERTIRTR
jgi:hypothetical protein